jgi:hypothetical protein
MLTVVYRKIYFWFDNVEVKVGEEFFKNTSEDSGLSLPYFTVTVWQFIKYFCTL